MIATSRPRSSERVSDAIFLFRREEYFSKQTDTVHAKPRIISTLQNGFDKKTCAQLENKSKLGIFNIEE